MIDQGVIPVFSDPASPQQDGRHERMHKDLKAYCRHKIPNTLGKQQLIMNDFVKEYNTIRPNESLNMKTPIEVHIKSNRRYSEKKIQYKYPLHYKVTKVCINGAARWGAYNWPFISRAARGRYIGVEEKENGIWNVCYRDVLLGYIDEKLIDAKETYLHIQKSKCKLCTRRGVNYVPYNTSFIEMNEGSLIPDSEILESLFFEQFPCPH